MFQFIICDDEVMFAKSIVKLIDGIFMKNNFEYKTMNYSFISGLSYKT